MMYVIYKITNKINNKVYIGKTDDLYNRLHNHMHYAKCGATNEFYRSSGKYNYIHKSIAKHGVDNFSVEIIDQNESEEIILELEVFYISKYKSKNPSYGYNLTDGGEGSSGRKHSDAAKQKIREKAIGRLHTEETKKILSKNRSGINSIKNKLTWDKVDEIRKIRIETNISYTKLAKLFEVSKTLIKDICLNKKWKIENK